MKLKQRVKELEEALKPFAKFGKYMEINPFMRFRPDEAKVANVTMLPKIKDFRKAAEVLEVEAKFELPKLGE